MKRNIESLQSIFDRVNELNRRNNLLKAKYENDTKYARLHKRILERGNISKSESEIQSALLSIKRQADEKVLLNNRLLNNDGFFSGFMMNLVIDGFDKTRIKLEPESARYLNNYFVKEYLDEFTSVNEKDVKEIKAKFEALGIQRLKDRIIIKII